tara:strand:+ start:267 stop:881 length:615 start_codon:yes stop_codon:yes gene_type:complete
MTKAKVVTKTLHEKLNLMQTTLKVPKGQTNNFGGYKYRSAEDILEALKPHLKEHNLTLTITERTEELGGYLFVFTTARLIDEEGEFIETTSQAGIDPNRKGMDIAQSFGSSSSYSKKYALGNLFLIDDTKDSDATIDPKEVVKPAKATKKKMTPAIKSLMLTSIDAGNSGVVTERMNDYTMTKIQREQLEHAMEQKNAPEVKES